MLDVNITISNKKNDNTIDVSDILKIIGIFQKIVITIGKDKYGRNAKDLKLSLVGSPKEGSVDLGFCFPKNGEVPIGNKQYGKNRKYRPVRKPFN